MSFFHVCSFITPIDADVHARDLPKLLHVLRPVFARCKVSYQLGDAAIERLHASERSFDEIWTNTSGPEKNVVSDFEHAVAGRDDTTVWMNALGPLLHRAPGTTAPRWYGHWRMDRGFHELQLRLTSIDGQLHELEVWFPLVGYPLTPLRLAGTGLVEGDAAAASANREAIVPLIAPLRAALGLPPGSWTVEGGFAFDFPAERDEMERVLARAVAERP
jgi:hypothetical protein